MMTRRPKTTRPRTVVFVSYNGLLDPLGSSQILPYLERLRREWPIHILSFERPHRLADGAALAAMERRLDEQTIGWTRLRYHKWPSLPATTYDLLTGVLALRRILRAEPVGLVHARGYLPTDIAMKATRRHPVLFDIRGLQPEEYVDGGNWKRGELKWRLTKMSERRFFRRAAGAVMLTETIRPYVSERFAEHDRAPPLEVIPCCVDLERFRFRADARAAIRGRLGIADDVTCFVYSGSIGTWYLADEMARLVRAFRASTDRKVCLLWMVNNDGEAARAAGVRAGLLDGEQRVATAAADEVADYLSAADVGLALIKPSFSKRASSPTKYAECLAVGLPLVLSRGVGDSARIADGEGAVALDRFDDAALADAARALVPLLARPREHFRRLAAELFDVETVGLPAYRRIYQRLSL
jgi:glycosyltransferase involved in cell wall biosynthesis